jgi:hypothetical protein
VFIYTNRPKAKLLLIVLCFLTAWQSIFKLALTSFFWDWLLQLHAVYIHTSYALSALVEFLNFLLFDINDLSNRKFSLSLLRRVIVDFFGWCTLFSHLMETMGDEASLFSSTKDDFPVPLKHSVWKERPGNNFLLYL